MSLNVMFFLSILLLLGMIAWTFWRTVRRWKGVEGDFLPTDAPKPGRTIRLTESLVLLLLGGSIFAICIINPNTGGQLLNLGRVPADYFPFYLAVMGVAAAGVLLSIAVALTGRLRTAVFLMAGVFICYGTYLNIGTQRQWHRARQRERDQFEQRRLNRDASRRFTPPDTAALTIRLGDVKGVELWVNGVHLGKTPVRTTFGEFKQKVPSWSEQPEDYETSRFERWRYNMRHPAHTRSSHKWFRFDAPIGPEATDHWVKCYGRARLGEEWGYATGGVHSGGGEDSYEWNIGVVFPERQARLEWLLDQARARDYRVDDDWLDALDTYDDQGWALVRQRTATEPEFNAILEQRVVRAFDLNRIDTPDKAWAFFESRIENAERTGVYDTGSLTGQSVEWIAPRLDTERLARLAEDIIPRHDMITVVWGEQAGQIEFGSPTITTNQFGRKQYNSRQYGHLNSSGRGNDFPPRAFVIAHAVWIADRLLDANGSEEPNSIEQRVTPQILRWHHENDLALKTACILGGPKLDRFLSRKDWMSSFDETGRNWNDMLSIHGVRINKWFYFLVQRGSASGREFRHNEIDRVMDLADQLTEQWGLQEQKQLLDFLFLDPELGENSPAMRYCPRFTKKRLFGHDYDMLNDLFLYLMKMEPQTPAEMYVDAFRMSIDRARAQNAAPYSDDTIKRLEKLAPAKRIEVIAAIADRVVRESDPATGDPTSPADKIVTPDHLVRAIDDLCLKWGVPKNLVALIEDMRHPENTSQLQYLEDWLTHERPDHPLIVLLAQDADPRMRFLVMGALEANPTTANRVFLQTLLRDPDARVRSAAESVQAALDELAETPPAQFAAN